MDRFLGDPYGQPVPPRLQPLFYQARDAGMILAALGIRKHTKAIRRYVRGITPAAICPLCFGGVNTDLSCSYCASKGYYTLEEFDDLPEERLRQIKRFQ